MSLLRSTVIFLVILALLASPGVAQAASRLTATPPVALPKSAPAPVPATTSSSPGSASGLPHTGDDLVLQLGLAAVMLASGGLLRGRTPRPE